MGRRRIRRTHTGFDIPRIPFFDYERQKEKACDSKETYYTSTEAEKAALVARALRDQRNVRPYKCRYCDYYHIGHQYT